MGAQPWNLNFLGVHALNIDLGNLNLWGDQPWKPRPLGGSTLKTLTFGGPTFGTPRFGGPTFGTSTFGALKLELQLLAAQTLGFLAGCPNKFSSSRGRLAAPARPPSSRTASASGAASSRSSAAKRPPARGSAGTPPAFASPSPKHASDSVFCAKARTWEGSFSSCLASSVAHFSRCVKRAPACSSGETQRNGCQVSKGAIGTTSRWCLVAASGQVCCHVCVIV